MSHVISPDSDGTPQDLLSPGSPVDPLEPAPGKKVMGGVRKWERRVWAHLCAQQALHQLTASFPQLISAGLINHTNTKTQEIHQDIHNYNTPNWGLQREEGDDTKEACIPSGVQYWVSVISLSLFALWLDLSICSSSRSTESGSTAAAGLTPGWERQDCNIQITSWGTLNPLLL